ncbi:MAG TPA: DUF4159 domain-containing protein [Gemmatimonadaceae bacterium]|nr:DUF4159 domain-containing protein [Gemmatimonadaceae bacterium]
MIQLMKPGRILLALMLVSAPLLAQRGRGGGGFNPGFRTDPVIEKIPYDGRFTLARLSFTTNSPMGYYYRGMPAWAHGYPNSEQNLMKIVSEISALHPLLEKSTVIAPDDPQLFKYPVAYMAEADYWGMSDKEAECLRAYLKKGGFIIFDDFRDDGRDGFQGWATFAAQMKRILPEGKIVDLAPTNPIFHSFFDINSFDIVPQYYDRSRPIFRGIFEDNDPKKRQMVMINFNTDVSNFWEFSATGFQPVEASNEAYKMGVNFIVYALTH